MNFKLRMVFFYYILLRQDSFKFGKRLQAISRVFTKYFPLNPLCKKCPELIFTQTQHSLWASDTFHGRKIICRYIRFISHINKILIDNNPQDIFIGQKNPTNTPSARAIDIHSYSWHHRQQPFYSIFKNHNICYILYKSVCISEKVTT
jgi:hypothetical protein